MKFPNIITIKSIQIEDIQIELDFFVSLKIYESLNQKGETATLVFRDYIFAEDALPILGGENVKIILQDSNKEIVKYDFIVTQKTKTEALDKSNQSQVYLYLVDKDYFNIQTISYPYGISGNLSASKILKKVLTDTRAINIKTELNIDKVSKNVVYNFYSPLNWSYDSLIDYLLNLYENQNEYGYFFFKDRFLKNSLTYKTQYVIKSSKDILKSKADLDTKTFNLHDTQSFNYIQKFKVQQGGADIVEQINSENLYFKSCTVNRNKELSIKEHDYTKFNLQYENGETKVGTKALDYSKKNYRNYRYIPEDYSSSATSSTILNNSIALEHFNQTSAEIMIKGRFNLKIGEKIFIHYNNESDVPNTNLNGYWIVYHINNEITNNIEFLQHVFLVKVQIKSLNKENVVNGK